MPTKTTESTRNHRWANVLAKATGSPGPRPTRAARAAWRQVGPASLCSHDRYPQVINRRPACAGSALHPRLELATSQQAVDHGVAPAELAIHIDEPFAGLAAHVRFIANAARGWVRSLRGAPHSRWARTSSRNRRVPVLVRHTIDPRARSSAPPGRMALRPDLAARHDVVGSGRPPGRHCARPPGCSREDCSCGMRSSRSGPAGRGAELGGSDHRARRHRRH